MIQYLNVKEIEGEIESEWVGVVFVCGSTSCTRGCMCRGGGGGGGVTCTDVAPISSIFYSLRYSISLLSTTCSRLTSL